MCGDLAFWELLSYLVTAIGLPLAIFTFWKEQRKERENEDEETYQLLSDAYANFLRLVLENSDLQRLHARMVPAPGLLLDVAAAARGRAGGRSSGS